MVLNLGSKDKCVEENKSEMETKFSWSSPVICRHEIVLVGEMHLETHNIL